MSFLPEVEQTFWQRLRLAVRHYFLVFKKTIWLIIIFTLVKSVTIYFGESPADKIINNMIEIVSALIFIYLWSVMLLMSHSMLTQQPVSLRWAFTECLRRIWPIFLSIIGYIILIAVVCGFSLLLLWISTKIWNLQPRIEAIAMLFIFGMPLLYFLVLTYFAFPLVVIGKRTPWAAFQQCVLITGKEWLTVLGIYMISIFFLMLIWPYTELGEFMRQHNIALVYDFILLAIFLPILSNLVVLTLHDLQLRYQEYQERL